MQGCGGDLPETPTAARVGTNGCAPAELRQQLKHLETDLDKHKISNITSKHRNLPERYYDSNTGEFVGPRDFENVANNRIACDQFSGNGAPDPVP